MSKLLCYFTAQLAETAPAEKVSNQMTRAKKTFKVFLAAVLTSSRYRLQRIRAFRQAQTGRRSHSRERSSAIVFSRSRSGRPATLGLDQWLFVRLGQKRTFCGAKNHQFAG